MSWTHLSDSKPTARKDHRCYLCARLIPVGERYVRRTGVDDGDLTTTAMHAECEAKTHGWGEEEWMSHDPVEFREYELSQPNP